MIKNEFDKDIKYRLYRTVKELLHPTISKKNISEYEIIIGDDLLPVYVYYPKIISSINKVLIYIHGDSKITECENMYSKICSELAIKSNSMVIAIDYEKMKNNCEKVYQKIYDTVKNIYNELTPVVKIALVGDSVGCNIINGINYLNKDINIEKEIFFYPILGTNKIIPQVEHELFNPSLLLDIDNYFKKIANKTELSSELLNYKGDIPTTLIIVGNVDPIKNSVKAYYKGYENIEYVEIPFASHGFLKSLDKEVKQDVYDAINKFLND